MRKILRCVLAVAIWLALFAPAPAAGPLGIAVADFDYVDTSGEATDQTAAHRARMQLFATQLRDDLARRAYRVVRPDCGAETCTARGMAPEELIAAARTAGARYLLYGGVRKMSTLVQWGEVQLLDLDQEQLLLRRTITFRGDTDQAFSRAAEFVGDTVNEAIRK